jgi:hypothetical protein
MNCNSEVSKAQHNIRLLENDWRLGPLRLAPPGQHHPPGYEHLRGEACSVDGFLQNMDRLSYGALPSAPDLYEPAPQPLLLPAAVPAPVAAPVPALVRVAAPEVQSYAGRGPVAAQVAAATASTVMSRMPEAAQHMSAAVRTLMSAQGQGQAPAAGAAGSS